MNAAIAETRPKRWSSVVKEDACRRLLDGLPAELIQVSDADFSVFVRCADENAYTFARNLDDRGLATPKFDLLEALDGYFAIQCSVHEETVRAWVERCEIEVPFVATDRVTHRRFGVGTIVEVRKKTAEVVLQLDDEVGLFSGRDGHILPFEDLTPLPPTERADG